MNRLIIDMHFSFVIFRVTDDILAMARPCTEIIYKKKVIEQFKR